MVLRSTAEPAEPRSDRALADGVMARKLGGELLGTALLVFFGAGMTTICFGFRAFGSSIAAGIVATGLVFGLVLAAIVAYIGPISGGHVNPAVTLGALLAKRIELADAIGYWVAQLVGGIIGALLLLWLMHGSPYYLKSRVGLGANGWGSLSLLHTSAGGAFLAEVILTAVFVLVVLGVTGRSGSAPAAGPVMGVAFALVIMTGVAFDGGSANPARSLGPALITGGQALSQVWLFIVAPLVGAALAAGLHILLHQQGAATAAAGEPGGRPEPALSQAGSGSDGAVGTGIGTVSRGAQAGGPGQAQGPGNPAKPGGLLPRAAAGQSAAIRRGSRGSAAVPLRLRRCWPASPPVRRSPGDRDGAWNRSEGVAAARGHRDGPLGAGSHRARLEHGAARFHRGQRRAADHRQAPACLAGRAAVDGDRVHADAGLADPARRLAR
jgi:aquaporin Z